MSMGQVNLTINGKSYNVACDDGQEQRVMDLANYVDERVKQVASAGAAHNEVHTIVLASLMLADETFDLREQVGVCHQQLEEGDSYVETIRKDEAAVARAIDSLADRIDVISERMQKA